MQSNSIQDKLANLKSHLTMAKSLNGSEADDEYYNLLEKGKEVLGEMSPYMGYFYFEYGSFVLSKFQKSLDIFNPEAVPQADVNEDMVQYDEGYEEDSQEEKIGANDQKPEYPDFGNQQTPQKQSQAKIIKQVEQFKDQNVEIVQDQVVRASTPKIQQQQEKQQLDDIEIAYEHFQVSLGIYEKELEKIKSGEQSVLDKEEINRYIVLNHQRLGDLYMLDEKYTDAIAEFREAIKFALSVQNPLYMRRIAEMYFLVGNSLVLENKEKCEVLAIDEYIEAVNILIKYLKDEEHYDVSGFEIPTQNRIRVDRFSYLSAPKDSQTVVDVKQVISCLLDKIEDTFQQIGVREAFEKQKEKINKQKEQNTFKQVSKDVKVVSLGTFGNRKRSPGDSTQNVATLNPEAKNMEKSSTKDLQSTGQKTTSNNQKSGQAVSSQ